MVKESYKFFKGTMVRLVIKKDKKPVQVKAGSWICMCGLSRNQPYCDGSHRRAKLEEEEEGKLYAYDESLTRKEVEVVEKRQS